MSGQVKGIV